MPLREGRRTRNDIGLVVHFITASLVLFLEIPAANDLWAQGTSIKRVSHTGDRTRGLIDDFTRSLDADADFDLPRTPQNRPASDVPAFDIKAVRPLVRRFSEEMTQLTYALNEEMVSIPALRPSYAKALRLSGTGASVSKHAEKHGADRLLLEEIQQLDADWRDLAFRLERIDGLSDDAFYLIDAIHDNNSKLRQAIGIQPQLDRRQLYLKAASLAADLESLQEDLVAELGNGEDAKTLRRSVSRLRQSVLNLASVIRDDRAETNVIIEAYKQFETQWSPLVKQLSLEENRYIDHGLRRVAATSSEIHQLLLLPAKMDQMQFVQLASYLRKDIDEFFERTPLILIMRLPKSKQALTAAEQFNAASTDFSKQVNKGQTEDKIIDSFRRIEQAERAFVDVYRDVDSDKAVAVLNRISKTVNTIRTSLHLQRDDFDRHAAEDLAAAIQNFTEQIEVVTRRWLTQDRQPYMQACLQEAAELTRRAARMHDDLANGKSPASLSNQMTDLYDNWRRVYAFLIKCQTEERQAMGRISTSLTPALVQLRTMIQQ